MTMFALLEPIILEVQLLFEPITPQLYHIEYYLSLSHTLFLTTPLSHPPTFSPFSFVLLCFLFFTGGGGRALHFDGVNDILLTRTNNTLIIRTNNISTEFYLSLSHALFSFCRSSQVLSLTHFLSILFCSPCFSFLFPGGGGRALHFDGVNDIGVIDYNQLDSCEKCLMVEHPFLWRNFTLEMWVFCEDSTAEQEDVHGASLLYSNWQGMEMMWSQDMGINGLRTRIEPGATGMLVQTLLLDSVVSFLMGLLDHFVIIVAYN